MLLVSLPVQSIMPPKAFYPFVRTVLFPSPPALALFYEPKGGACIRASGHTRILPVVALQRATASMHFNNLISFPITKIVTTALPELSPPGELLSRGNHSIR